MTNPVSLPFTYSMQDMVCAGLMSPGQRSCLPPYRLYVDIQHSARKKTESSVTTHNVFYALSAHTCEKRVKVALILRH